MIENYPLTDYFKTAKEFREILPVEELPDIYTVGILYEQFY